VARLAIGSALLCLLVRYIFVRGRSSSARSGRSHDLSSTISTSNDSSTTDVAPRLAVILAGGPTLAGGKFLTPRRRQSRHRIHLLSDVERGLWRAVLLEGHLAPCNAPTTVRACTHAVASHELDNDVHVPEYTSRNTRDDRM
jgi:hypothetical protein